MGCICSKESSKSNDHREVNKSQVHLLPPTKREEVNGYGEGSIRSRPPSRVTSATNHSGSLSGSSRAPSKVNSGSTLANGYSTSLSNKHVDDHQGEKIKTIIVERPSSKGSHHRRATVDLGADGGQKPMSRISSMPRGRHGEQVVAGWPSWLSSVAGEAIQGWLPRRADSFEKLDKVGFSFPLWFSVLILWL